MDKYISREALIEMVNGSERPENERIDIGYNEALNDIKQRLVEMPAADVRPIRHGRWIITDDVENFIAVCSVCGRTEDSRCIDDMPYCHCGARMDGEQNDMDT